MIKEYKDQFFHIYFVRDKVKPGMYHFYVDGPKEDCHCGNTGGYDYINECFHEVIEIIRKTPAADVWRKIIDRD